MWSAFVLFALCMAHKVLSSWQPHARTKEEGMVRLLHAFLCVGNDKPPREREGQKNFSSGKAWTENQKKRTSKGQMQQQTDGCTWILVTWSLDCLIL